MIGVWPRGAQVRRTLGINRKPHSSRNTRWAFRRSEFFLPRPSDTVSVNSRLICATFSLPECAICWGTVSARVNPDRGGKESAISHGAKHDQVPEAAGTVQHADRRAGRL